MIYGTVFRTLLRSSQPPPPLKRGAATYRMSWQILRRVPFQEDVERQGSPRRPSSGKPRKLHISNNNHTYTNLYWSYTYIYISFGFVVGGILSGSRRKHWKPHLAKGLHDDFPGLGHCRSRARLWPCWCAASCHHDCGQIANDATENGWGCRFLAQEGTPHMGASDQPGRSSKVCQLGIKAGCRQCCVRWTIMEPVWVCGNSAFLGFKVWILNVRLNII